MEIVGISLVGVAISILGIILGFIWRTNGRYMRALQEGQERIAKGLQEGEERILNSLQELQEGQKEIAQDIHGEVSKIR